MSLFWTEGSWNQKIAFHEDGIPDRPRRIIDSDWVRPTDFPNLGDVIAVDVETRDPDLLRSGSKWAWKGHEGFICGVSVAWPGGKRYYPLRHEVGGNMEDESAVWRWLLTQINQPGVELIGANLSYDIGWIERTTGQRLICELIDVQGAASLLDENRFSYALDALAKEHLGQGKDEALLREAAVEFGVEKDLKGSLWRMPAAYVGVYAERDAEAALQLWRKYKPQLEAANLMPLYNLERKVLRVAIDMRHRGVRIDGDKVLAGIDHCRQAEDQARAIIRTHTECEVDPWDAISLERALEAHGITVPRTTRDKPSITRQWLALFDDPVTNAIADLRRWAKLRGTFFEGHLTRFAWNGRIHAEFNPLRRQDDEGTGWGTVSGRFSSTDPNLQHIPHRDPQTTPLIRDCFLPEEGGEWLVADYHSQEPRLSVHFAALTERRRPDLVHGALEVVQQFQRHPRMDLHQHTADRMDIPRGQAKTINLALTYGMQGKRLCANLGLPTKWITTRDGREVEVAGEEGEQLLDNHRQAVPFMSELFNIAQNRAKATGEIRTLLGRACHFKPLPNGDGVFDSFKAMNRLIQGSAADQMKKAMVLLAEEGHPITLQVHDEIDTTISGWTAALEIRRIMEDATPLLLPVRVDLSCGPSWGRVMKVDDERQVE